MKVLILTPHLYIEGKKSFEHNKTGFSIMVAKIVEGLSKAGAKTNVLVQTSLTNGFNWNGVKFIRFSILNIIFTITPKYVKLAFKMIKKLPKIDLKSVLRIFYWCMSGGYVEKIIKKEKPDVVNIHSTMAPTIPLLLACSQYSVKCILTIHAGDTDSDIKSANTPFRFLFYKYQELASKKGIPMTTVSNGIKEQLLKMRNKVDDDNIYVVPNATDISDIECVTNIDIRKKYKINKEQRIMLCVGSICERKNQIQLVRTLSKIDKDMLKTVKVLLLGNNMLGDTIYKEIEQYQLKDSVEICGFVQREDLIAYYQQADFNVLLSVSEGFGLSIIEARKFGLPTLTFSDLDAVDDIYDSLSMHLVIDREDNNLAIELEKFLNSNWNKNKIKENSKGFSLEDVGNNYLKVYENINFSNFSSEDVFNLLN